MKFSVTSIIKNRNLYLTTFVTFLIIAYISILSNLWLNAYSNISTSYQSFTPKESLIIEKINIEKPTKYIDISEIESIDKILGEFDAIIKKTIYRVEFSGLAKNGEFEAEFSGIGIDLKRDKSNLDNYIQITKGLNLQEDSQNSIIISETIAKNLRVDVNQSIELYVLNRDDEIFNDEVMNIASLNISGIFQEPFSSNSLIILPIRLSDFILKTSTINSVIIEFYLKEDSKRFKLEVNEKLKSIGLNIKENKNISQFQDWHNILYVLYTFLLFTVVIIAHRDSRLLIERKRNNISTLIHYDWKRSDIFLLNLKENLIFNILAFGFLTIIIFAILSLNINYPSIFTNFNLNIHIDVKFLDVILYSIPIFIINFLVHTIIFQLFSNFKR